MLTRALSEGDMEKVTFKINCENKITSLADDIREIGYPKQENIMYFLGLSKEL